MLPETRGKMHRHVAVPLLEPVIFPYIMKIVPTDDNSTLHLHFLHHSGEDTSAN